MYRAYWRYFTAGTIDDKQWKPAGDRAIRTAISTDFVHWKQQADLTYVDSPSEHMYTNQVKPYHRAPHLLIGIPTRYVDRGWSESMRQLPDLAARVKSARRPTSVTAPRSPRHLLMCSRDGVRFKRWNEAFMRPGIEREGTWQYGQQYVAWHFVETKSSLPVPRTNCRSTPPKATGRATAVHCDDIRCGSMASWRSCPDERRGVAHETLYLHRQPAIVELCNLGGGGRARRTAYDRRSADRRLHSRDCAEMFGDSLDRTVTWKSGADVSG